MNFNHLKKLEINDKTSEMTLFSVPGEPTLILRPATEVNKPYFNAVLKRTKRNMAAVKGGGVNATMIQESRADDKDLYSKHVIVGWNNMIDADGQMVAFSPANCAEFLDCLPDWMFDDIRAHAADPANFMAVIDIEGRLKN